MFNLYKRNAQLRFCRVYPPSSFNWRGGLVLGAKFRWVRCPSCLSRKDRSGDVKILPTIQIPTPQNELVPSVDLSTPRQMCLIGPHQDIHRRPPCAWDPGLVGRRRIFLV